GVIVGHTGLCERKERATAFVLVERSTAPAGPGRAVGDVIFDQHAGRDDRCARYWPGAADGAAPDWRTPPKQDDREGFDRRGRRGEEYLEILNSPIRVVAAGPSAPMRHRQQALGRQTARALLTIVEDGQIDERLVSGTFEHEEELRSYARQCVEV